jgi:hypothetical protein
VTGFRFVDGVDAQKPYGIDALLVSWRVWHGDSYVAAEPSLAIYLASTPLFLDPVAPHFATGMTQIGVETSAELRRVDYGSSSGTEETICSPCSPFAAPPNVRFSKGYSMSVLPPKADIS